MAFEIPIPIMWQPLEQEQKNRGVTTLVTASSNVIVHCSDSMAWSAGMTATNGVFTNGKADATPAVVDPAGPTAGPATIQLFWNR